MSSSRREFLIGSALTSVLATVPGCGPTSGEASSTLAVASASTLAAATPTPTVTPTATATATTTFSGVVVQAGDSIGVGYGSPAYAAIDHLGLGDGVAVYNVSVGGRTMLTGYQGRAELFAYHDDARTSVLLIEQGTNDLYGSTSAQALYGSIAVPFVAAARAAGFYVALGTILPRDDTGWTAAMEAQRQAYNALVRSNAAGADAINDVAADAAMGDASGVPTSYYADGLHPTLLGQQRLALIDVATVAALLAGTPRQA